MRLVLPEPRQAIFLDVEYTPWKKTMVIGFFHRAYGYRYLYKKNWRARIPPRWVRSWFNFLTSSKGANILVTYSGRKFDVDAILSEPGVDLLGEFNLQHFDLFDATQVLAEASLIRKKGLEDLERHFKIFRPKIFGIHRRSIHELFQMVEGRQKEAEFTQDEALERLVTYNYFDTVNLYFILCRLRDKYGEILDSEDLAYS